MKGSELDLKLLGGISKESLNIFHEKVVYLIKNAGIQVKNKKILKRLADFDGVKINENVVTFSEEIINKYIFNIEFDLPDYFYGDNFTIITGTAGPMIKDSTTGNTRFATSKDLINITKLEDSLAITGTASVRPNDIPKHLQEIFIHKSLWENSRYKGNDIFEHNYKSTIPCCKYLYEMAQVLNKRFTIGLWIESPRAFNETF